MPIASTDVYTKQNIWPLSPFISLLSPFISIIYLRKLNKNIEKLGYYLLMCRLDGFIDVLYVNKEHINLYENFSSVTPISLRLNFMIEDYINNEAIIVSKNQKYGLICGGKFVAECIYDEISAINVNPNMTVVSALTANPLWFVLRIGNKKGIYSTCRIHGVMTEIIYDNVNVLDWRVCHPNKDYGSREFVLELDGKYYTTEDVTLICKNCDLIFRGFITSEILVFSNDDSSSLELYNYRGKKFSFIAFDVDGDLIDEDDFEDSDSFYSYCEYAVPDWGASFSVELAEEEYVYSFSKNEIINNPYFEANEDEEEDDDYYYDDTDYQDDTDYERDTFYALGGYDYDEWKENGGNLDDMMDGMGF